MPMITIPVASLTGGVSRQPPTQRNRNQVETADNVTLCMTRGAEKRCGTEYIASPDTDTGALDVVEPTLTSFAYHWIDRDPDHRYVCIINDDISVVDEDTDNQGVIQIYDLLGEKKTVEYVTRTRDYGVGPFGEVSPLSYLRRTADTLTKDKVKAITVADATFLLNTKTIPELYGDAANYQYSGTAVRNSANAHNVDTAEDFDRPPGASDQYWYAQAGSPGRPSGFYKSQGHTGVGPWYTRVVSEAEDGNLRWDHMPIQLTWYEDVDKFIISFVTWDPRYAGDATSNVPPSFTSNYIADMTFHRNRLVFGSGESVVCGQSGDLFNFWRDDVDQVVDSDPVDVSFATNQVTDVQWLVPFNKSLVVLTNGSKQFELRSDGNLTPDAANLVATTGYPSLDTVRPITVGNQMYWITERGESSQVFEYFYSLDAASNTAVDITSHVEGYLPASIDTLSSSTSNGILFCSSTEEPYHLYLYYLYWSGEQKVQSSWCRWVFDDSIEILSHHVYDDYLYLLIRRDSLIWLERVKISIPTPDLESVGNLTPWSYHCDSRRVVEGVYSAVDRETTWTLTHEDTTIDEVVLGAEWEEAKGKRITATNESVEGLTVLTAAGRLDQHPVWVGRNFPMILRLSEQTYRDQNNAVVNGILQLRTLSVFHKDSSYYEVHVTPVGREQQVFAFNAMRVGGEHAYLDVPQIESSGYFACKPMVSANGAVIEIRNNTSLPTTITNLEFVASFVPRRTSITR